MRSVRGVSAAVVVLVSASAASRAADLPSIMVPVSVFSWTGFYLGVNAGYSFDDATRFALSNGTGITATNTEMAQRDRQSLKTMLMDLQQVVSSVLIINSNLGALGAMGAAL